MTDMNAEVQVLSGFEYETEKNPQATTLIELGADIEHFRKSFGGVSVEKNERLGAVVFSFPGTSWTFTVYGVDIIDTRKAWRAAREVERYGNYIP